MKAFVWRHEQRANEQRGAGRSDEWVQGKIDVPVLNWSEMPDKSFMRRAKTCLGVYLLRSGKPSVSMHFLGTVLLGQIVACVNLLWW